MPDPETIPAPQSDPSDPLIGITIAGRYMIEVRLGEGAMGSVYRARHIKVGRPFAVKVLHPKLLADKKVMQRFDREAELAGRLRHPNVIGVVDVGETPDGLRYMVMDFAEGNDLAGLLSEAPMPAARVMNITRQILEGLFHAHEAGLIHRDFKPENVIIERDAHGHEVPRIVDFGIAIIKEGGDSANGQGRLTTNGLVLGTPHYMAPEQAVADPIDHRIDLFALGICVYEMLCGKLPFDGTGAEVARANLLLDPPMIAQRVPYLEVDPLLEAFARRMMAKRRDARPPTARAAREILDLIERDRPAAAMALGITLPAQDASRKPAITQDAMPQIPSQYSEPQFDPTPQPPPLSPRAQTQPTLPSALDAPPMPMTTPAPISGPTLPLPGVHERTPVVQPAADRHIATSDVSPLRYDELPGSKRRLAIIIGAILVAAIAAILIIKATGGKNQEPVLAIGSGSGSAERVASAVVPALVPDAAVEVGSGSAEIVGSGSAPGSDVGSDVVVDIGSGSAKKGSGSAKRPDRSGSAKKPDLKVGSGSAKPEVGSGSAATPGTPSSGEVVTLFQAVGRDLETLRAKKGDDSIADLQPRYRLIQIQDAISSPGKRTVAFAQLERIQRDIKAKLK